MGKFLDTSSSEQGYNQISKNKTYPEILFTFNTCQDVINYWNQLYDIVSMTKLGFKTKRIKKDNKVKRGYIPDVGTVKFEEAPIRDVGYLPGDNLGAAGIDSKLFVHLKRNWRFRLKRKIGSSKLVQSQSSPKIKKIKRKNIEEKRSKLTLVGRYAVQRGKGNRKGVAVKKKKNRQEYDEVDKEAIKHMKSLRVNWSAEEDRMLKICRAIYLYIGESLSSRNIQYSTIRDILHWSVKSLNKTARACQRRLIFLIRTKRELPNTASWLHELKQNQSVVKMYGPNLANDLRKIYPEDEDFIVALRIHFIKLVSYLVKIINHTNQSTETEVILPDTLHQFNMLYQQSSVSIAKDQLKYTEPEDIKEIELSTINGLIHSSVCSLKDKTLYNIQLFEIYKAYNEQNLALAFEKARSDHLVVTTKTQSCSSYTEKLLPLGPSLMLSSKYRFQLIFINIIYRALEEYYRQYQNYLYNSFGGLNEPYELSLNECGNCLMLAEISMRSDVAVGIKLPHRILIVDPQEEKTKGSEKVLEHFRQLFENSRTMEYMKNLDKTTETTGKKPKIKFNMINESYKMQFDPFEILINLRFYYLHFFCILGCLGIRIETDFKNLGEDEMCPFNCVINNADFITSIEKIISNNKEFLMNLSQKKHVGSEILAAEVVIDQSNIIQIYRKLLNVMKKRSLDLLRKDLGKITLQPKEIDIVALAKELVQCFERETFINDAECMPTFESKPERIIKAQDVFVVNLPKINICHIEQGENKVPYKKMMVPESLVEVEFNKEEIIQKIIREYVLSNKSSTIEEVREDLIGRGYSQEDVKNVFDVLEFIESKEIGVSAMDLLEKFGLEEMILKSISILRDHALIMRVGVERFTYVHRNYIRPWVVAAYHLKRLEREKIPPNTLELEPKNREDEGEPAQKKCRFEDFTNPIQEQSSSNTNSCRKGKEKIILRPCPWMRVNGSLNRRVLDKWMGSILLETITINGIRVIDLCERFNFLHPVNIMFLLEILQDIGCVRLKAKKAFKATLTSKYKSLIISDANELNSKEDMFVEVTPDAIMKYSMFIGERKYKADFI